MNLWINASILGNIYLLVRNISFLNEQLVTIVREDWGILSDGEDIPVAKHLVEFEAFALD